MYKPEDIPNPDRKEETFVNEEVDVLKLKERELEMKIYKQTLKLLTDLLDVKQKEFREESTCKCKPFLSNFS